MKKISFFLVMCLLSVCVFLTYSQSTEIESTEGEVVLVSKNKIVIKEYDYEKDSSINNTYVINSETELIGVDTITEIMEGTTVEIEYVVESKNNFIAKSIYVNEIMYDEDENEENGNENEDE